MNESNLSHGYKKLGDIMLVCHVSDNFEFKIIILMIFLIFALDDL